MKIHDTNTPQNMHETRGGTHRFLFSFFSFFSFLSFFPGLSVADSSAPAITIAVDDADVDDDG
jgi:hypothetical protein